MTAPADEVEAVARQRCCGLQGCILEGIGSLCCADEFWSDEARGIIAALDAVRAQRKSPEIDPDDAYDRVDEAALDRAGMWARPPRYPPEPKQHDEPDCWKCVHGHDRCDQMYPGPECPYCEPLDPPPTPTPAPQSAMETAREIIASAGLPESVTLRGRIASALTAADAAGYERGEAKRRELNDALAYITRDRELAMEMAETQLATIREERDVAYEMRAARIAPDITAAYERGLMTGIQTKLEAEAMVSIGQRWLDDNG